NAMQHRRRIPCRRARPHSAWMGDGRPKRIDSRRRRRRGRHECPRELTVSAWASCYGEQGGPQEMLPTVSQEMRPRMLGTMRPRVNCFMNKFRKLGLIEYDDEIHINNSLLSVVPHE